MARPSSSSGGRRRSARQQPLRRHSEGAWKIAYADFVTAMMALFMLLWLLASTNEQSRDEISRYFRTGIMPNAELAMNGGAQYIPSVMGKSTVPTPPDDQTIADSTAAILRNAIQNMAMEQLRIKNVARSAHVTITDEGVLIEVVDEAADDLLFDSASAQLKPALEDFLRALAPVLAKHRDHPIEIQGHTDARPFFAGSRTNWELSSERAAAARRIFEANGIETEQIVGVIGRGSAVPLVPSDPLSPRNRRLSILLRDPPVAKAAIDPLTENRDSAKRADGL